MIATDQPRCFGNSVLAVVSSRDDGTVLDRSLGVHDGSITSNRTRFCKAAGLDYGDVVFQRIVYSPDATYSLLAEVDTRSTTKFTSEVVADAVFTEAKGVGLFLPVADCVATIVHDPKRELLAVLHLGRHSTVTELVSKTVKHFVARGSTVDDLVIWMSPSAQRSTYKLEYFDLKDSPQWLQYCDVKEDGVYIDMQGYNRQRFIDMGVKRDSIHISQVNTMEDSEYFSHARGDAHGRMAVVAMMR